MEFTVTEREGGVGILHLEGRLNMVTAGALRDAVNSTVAGGHPRVVVDLAGVDFMDSSGLGALINGLKTARQAGGDLRIASPNQQVQLVLQLTNVERVLPAYDSAELAYAVA
ncbi:MAG: STAS domain-containing protein [Rhodoglobus sp.]